jgi:hypothetical protein
VVYEKGFVKRSNNALIRRAKNSACTRARILDLLYKEIFPPDAEIFSLAEL